MFQSLPRAAGHATTTQLLWGLREAMRVGPTGINYINPTDDPRKSN
jgi:hypothetical protein